MAVKPVNFGVDGCSVNFAALPLSSEFVAYEQCIRHKTVLASELMSVIRILIVTIMHFIREYWH